MGFFGGDNQTSSTTNNLAQDSSQNLADLAAGIQGDFNTITRYDVTGDALASGMDAIAGMNADNLTFANAGMTGGLNVANNALAQNLDVMLIAGKVADNANSEMGVLTANALGQNTVVTAAGMKLADNLALGAFDLAAVTAADVSNVANNSIAAGITQSSMAMATAGKAMDQNSSLAGRAMDIAAGVDGYKTLETMSGNYADVMAATLNVADNLGAEAISAGAKTAANAFGLSLNTTAIGAAVAGKSMDMADAQNARASALAAGIVGSNANMTLGLNAQNTTFAGDAIKGAQDSANVAVSQITELADSGFSKMADLVTANAKLAGSVATGGGTTLVEAGKAIGIAAAVAVGLWAMSRRA